MLYAHMADPPPRVSDHRPDLPGQLDEVMTKAMAKDPAERPSSAGGADARRQPRVQPANACRVHAARTDRGARGDRHPTGRDGGRDARIGAAGTGRGLPGGADTGGSPAGRPDLTGRAAAGRGCAAAGSDGSWPGDPRPAAPRARRHRAPLATRSSALATPGRARPCRPPPRHSQPHRPRPPSPDGSCPRRLPRPQPGPRPARPPRADVARRRADHVAGRWSLGCPARGRAGRRRVPGRTLRVRRRALERPAARRVRTARRQPALVLAPRRTRPSRVPGLRLSGRDARSRPAARQPGASSQWARPMPRCRRCCRRPSSSAWTGRPRVTTRCASATSTPTATRTSRYAASSAA